MSAPAQEVAASEASAAAEAATAEAAQVLTGMSWSDMENDIWKHLLSGLSGASGGEEPLPDDRTLHDVETEEDDVSSEDGEWIGGVGTASQQKKRKHREAADVASASQLREETAMVLQYAEHGKLIAEAGLPRDDAGTLSKRRMEELITRQQEPLPQDQSKWLTLTREQAQAAVDGEKQVDAVMAWVTQMDPLQKPSASGGAPGKVPRRLEELKKEFGNAGSNYVTMFGKVDAVLPTFEDCEMRIREASEMQGATHIALPGNCGPSSRKRVVDFHCNCPKPRPKQLPAIAQAPPAAAAVELPPAAFLTTAPLSTAPNKLPHALAPTAAGAVASAQSKVLADAAVLGKRSRSAAKPAGSTVAGEEAEWQARHGSDAIRCSFHVKWVKIEGRRRERVSTALAAPNRAAPESLGGGLGVAALTDAATAVDGGDGEGGPSLLMGGDQIRTGSAGAAASAEDADDEEDDEEDDDDEDDDDFVVESRTAAPLAHRPRDSGSGRASTTKVSLKTERTEGEGGFELQVASWRHDCVQATHGNSALADLGIPIKKHTAYSTDSLRDAVLHVYSGTPLTAIDTDMIKAALRQYCLGADGTESLHKGIMTKLRNMVCPKTAGLAVRSAVPLLALRECLKACGHECDLVFSNEVALYRLELEKAAARWKGKEAKRMPVKDKRRPFNAGLWRKNNPSPAVGMYVTEIRVRLSYMLASTQSTDEAKQAWGKISSADVGHGRCRNQFNTFSLMTEDGNHHGHAIQDTLKVGPETYASWLPQFERVAQRCPSVNTPGARCVKDGHLGMNKALVEALPKVTPFDDSVHKERHLQKDGDRASRHIMCQIYRALLARRTPETAFLELQHMMLENPKEVWLKFVSQVPLYRTVPALWRAPSRELISPRRPDGENDPSAREKLTTQLLEGLKIPDDCGPVFATITSNTSESHMHALLPVRREADPALALRMLCTRRQKQHLTACTDLRKAIREDTSGTVVEYLEGLVTTARTHVQRLGNRATNASVQRTEVPGKFYVTLHCGRDQREEKATVDLREEVAALPSDAERARRLCSLGCCTTTHDGLCAHVAAVFCDVHARQLLGGVPLRQYARRGSTVEGMARALGVPLKTTEAGGTQRSIPAKAPHYDEFKLPSDAELSKKYHELVAAAGTAENCWSARFSDCRWVDDTLVFDGALTVQADTAGTSATTTVVDLQTLRVPPPARASDPFRAKGGREEGIDQSKKKKKKEEEGGSTGVVLPKTTTRRKCGPCGITFSENTNFPVYIACVCKLAYCECNSCGGGGRSNHNRVGGPKWRREHHEAPLDQDGARAAAKSNGKRKVGDATSGGGAA